MQKEKIPQTQLRFDSKKQRNAIKRIGISKKNSMNREILIAIDDHIAAYNQLKIKL